MSDYIIYSKMPTGSYWNYEWSYMGLSGLVRRTNHKTNPWDKRWNAQVGKDGNGRWVYLSTRNGAVKWVAEATGGKQ